MRLSVGKKSFMKFGLCGLILLSFALVGYFFLMYVIPAFGTIDDSNTYVNTTVLPDKWMKNNTAGWLNFTITLSNGNVTVVNITVPNTTTAVNFSVENATSGLTPRTNDATRTWTWDIIENRTGLPAIIKFNTSNSTSFTQSVRFDLYVTPQVTETANTLTQNWNISVQYNQTDQTTTINRTTLTMYVDSKVPVLNTTTPANNSYIYGRSNQLFQINATDTNLNVSNVTLHYRQQGTSTYTDRALTCYYGSSTPFICNSTVDLSSWAAVVVEYYFEGSDNVTNYGNNGTSANPLTATIDFTTPKYSGDTVNVSSGSKYTPGQGYNFRITWTDTGGSSVSTVLFESNFTGEFANTTATSCGTSLYCANFSQEQFKNASVGFAYKWYANDSVAPTTDANWNGSYPLTFYNFSLADNPVNLYLNGSLNQNAAVVYPARVNATGVVTAGEMFLYRNLSGTFTDVGATENRTDIRLPVATHEYKVNTSGNSNYSANNSAPTYYVVVSQGATTVNLYLNDSQSSMTIASGSGVNITALASNSEGVVWIYNGTNVANQSNNVNNASNITTWSGAPGTRWNITGYYNGSQNYSASSPAGTCSACNYSIIIESTPPTYRDNNTNVTASVWGKYQGIIGVNVAWNDNFNVSSAWLYHNETASWRTNYSGFGASNVTNFTIDPSEVTITAGSNVTIQARVYANDTSNNTNNTNTWTWIIDGTAPLLTSPTPTNDTLVPGTSTQLFQINVTDQTLNVSNATVHFKQDGAPSYNNTFLNCYGTAPSFTCNISANLVSITGTVLYYFEASDNSSGYGYNGMSSDPMRIIIDRIGPAYSNNNTNTTFTGKYDTVIIYANWTDTNGLGHAILETNESGTAANKSITAYGSPYDINLSSGKTWSNFTWSNSSVAVGTVIQWKIYANDTAGNQNVTAAGVFTIDGTAPWYSLNNTNITSDSTIPKGTPILIYAYWNDGLRLSEGWVEHNETGGPGFTNTSITITGDNNSTNYTINTSGVTAGKTFQARLFVNDTSGNSNYTSPTWNWTIDGTQPTPANVSLNGASGNSTSGYAPGKSYIFNVSWADNLGNANVSAVLLNLSYSATNYSASYLGSSNWSVTVTDLPTGNYTYKWYANDTSGNWNETDIYSFNVTQNATNPVRLYLNDTLSADLNVTYPARVNATAFLLYPDAGAVHLYRNDSLKDSENATNVRLANETYIYVANTSGTVNYTANSTSFYVRVSKGAPNISLWIGQSGSQVEANATIVQGQTLNITATIDTVYNVTIKINTSLDDGWRNQSASGTRLENTSSSASYTGTTDYNITAYFEGDGNYTEYSQTWWLNITGDTTGPAVRMFDNALGYYVFNNASAKKSYATFSLNVSVVDAGIGVLTNEMCFAKIGSATAQNFANYSSGWCNGTVNVSSSTEGANLLNITVNDTNDYKGYNDTYYITIDNTPPIIVISTPSNASYNKLVGYVWINGTTGAVSDNLQMGTGNISVNNTNFTVYNFTGANATTFAIYNSSPILDGYVALRLNYTDNATNVYNATVYFYEDNTAPNAAYGLTNSTGGNYQSNATQIIQVLVNDLQTNATITLNYYINGSWFTNVMTGSPSASTIYNATINTIANVSGFASNGTVSYVLYYITGADNATNNITASVGGSSSSGLSNLVIDQYCGNNGLGWANGFCSDNKLYGTGWKSLDMPGETVVETWGSLSSNFTVPKVFESVSGKYNLIYQYNGTAWASYNPAAALSYSPLQQANATNNYPYWFNMTSPGVVRVNPS